MYINDIKKAFSIPQIKSTINLNGEVNIMPDKLLKLEGNSHQMLRDFNFSLTDFLNCENIYLSLVFIASLCINNRMFTYN